MKFYASLKLAHAGFHLPLLPALMLCCSWYCFTSSCVAVSALDLITVNGTYVLRNLTKALPFYYALYLFPYRTKERNERRGKKKQTPHRSAVTSRRCPLACAGEYRLASNLALGYNLCSRISNPYSRAVRDGEWRGQH